MTGAVTSDTFIGDLVTARGISAKVEAKGGDIGIIAAQTISGNVTADKGNIGFGIPNGWSSACNSWQFGGDYPGALNGNGVTATGEIKGSIEAPEGSINYVRANTITATGTIGGVTSGGGVGGAPSNGGDLTGTIQAGTSIGSVRALASPFNPGVGSVADFFA